MNSELFVNPIFGSPATVVVVGAVLVVLLLVGPAFRSLSLGHRLVLSALRLIVILLVVLIMLRPGLRTTITERLSSTLLVFFDQSRSMQVPDMPGGKSRWQAQRQTLEEVAPILSKLAGDVDVKIYAFDSAAHRIEFKDGKIAFPEKPEGRMTDIGSSLDDGVRREAGKPLAGAILLSDGAQRAFAPRVEMQQAARELALSGYPLYTVAFGLDIEKSQARDVAVENLQDHYTVFVKNELVVKSLLRVRGFVNQRIPVELEIEDASGNKKVVDTVPLVAAEDGEQLPVEMAYTPQEAGQYRLTLRAAEQPGELDTKNNELSAFLTVLKGGLKVLYLEGELRPEQKYLRWAINSSVDIQLDFRWIDHRRRDRWPVDLEKEFRDPEYDVFILGDLDSAALWEKGRNERNLDALRDAVDRGKGLIMLGGYHSFGAGGYRNTPLADVLPVLMDRLERQDFDAPIRKDLHHEGPLRMLPTGDDFVTHLAAGTENQAVWGRLRPLDGANRFVGLKPDAKILAQSPGGVPLLVAGEYGLRGRVLAMAGDSTWYWWMQGHQAEHKRFWRQVVLWLAGKDEMARQDVWIELPQRRYRPEARVTFTVGARSAGGDVIRGASFRAKVTQPDGRTQTIRLAANGDTMIGSIDATEAVGQYLIEVTADQGGQRLGKAQTKFLVLDQDIELSEPSANPDQLGSLAEITREAGGRRVAPEELAGFLKNELLAKMRKSHPELEIEVETRHQLGDRSIDAWLLLLWMVALLTGEWFLRKKWGLV